MEQRYIADCLSSLDSLIAAHTQKLDTLRSHKRGLMQQLFPVEGESVPRLRFPEFEGAGEWEERKLGEIATLRNGYAFKSSSYVENGKYRIITIGNVQAGELSIEGAKAIDELPKDIQRHQILQSGEILISMTGNVGRVCMVDSENCLLNQRVGKLVPHKIDKEFFYHEINSEVFREAMQSRAAGGAQGNLSSTAIEYHLIDFPTTSDEQTRIADCLSSIDTLISAQTDKIAELKTFKRGLMQQLFPAPERMQE
jgi:type I restriction enzyme, S subunit